MMIGLFTGHLDRAGSEIIREKSKNMTHDGIQLNSLLRSSCLMLLDWLPNLLLESPLYGA